MQCFTDMLSSRLTPFGGGRDLRIDWLRGLFDTKRYPWFRDEFIHPNDLTKPDSPARVDIVKPTVTRSPDHSLSIYVPSFKASRR